MADELNRGSYTDVYKKYGVNREILDTDFNPTRMTTPEVLPNNFNHNLHIDKAGLASKRLTFGTPSYPSPLDRIRGGRNDRANQFGLLVGKEASFEGNQSYPKINRGQLCLDETMMKPKTSRIIQGSKLNDVSYSPARSKGSFLSPHDSSLNMSNHENWSFYNYLGGHSTSAFPTTVRNPNKAICTINAKTSEILIANDIACVLFGYELENLIGKNLKDLIKLKPKDQATISESHLDEASGEMVSISGKVVDASDSEGIVMPVSIWVRKLNCKTEPRCLVVMEPVERTVAMVTFNNKGVILSCDHQLAYLHGFDSPDDLEGLDMTQLIPSFNIPMTASSLTKEIRKQQATGRTKDGVPFPLSISVKMASEIEDDPRNIPPNQQDGCYDNIYLGIVWVFSSISGLITFFPDGKIQSINENFSRLLFGYSSDELIGKNISMLIPEISEILEDKGFRAPMEDLGEDESVHIKKKKLFETDSSEDQGIGSSIVSGLAGRVDIPMEGLGDLKPGVTSTPNKVNSESFLKRALETENSKSIKNISPLAESDSIAIKLNLDSDSDSDEIIKPLYKSDVRSPVRLSDVSTSSAETIPTAREVKKFFPPIVPDAGGEIPSTNDRKSVEVETIENFPNEVQFTDRIDDLSDIESDNDPSDLSTSTTELLSAKVELMKLRSTEDLLNQSLTSEQFDTSGQGASGDISNNCQSSSANKEVTDESCHENQIQNNIDFIPPCGENHFIDSSSTESDYSCDEERPLPKHILSPLTGTSWEEPGTDSNLTDLMPEYDSSLAEKLGGYSASNGSDSMQLSNQSLSYSKSRSPRKHRRRHGDRKSVKDLQTSSGVYDKSNYTEGSFAGACVHKDGSHLGVIFQVKKVELDDGSSTYCMWVSRDPEDAPEYGKSFANLTLASTFNSTMDKSNCSLGEMVVDKNDNEEKEADTAEEESPGRGLYDLKYDTMDSIGKGAFGFVKTALRKTDGEEVVVKFIRKSKVLSECWITERSGDKIPMEVGLLRKLSHPNIVSVIDVFENDDYVQMVMEKHGSGMDLFEFIDRSPLLDETLASYIFKQMVSAISYLHKNGIIHRDVKDENVILNESFQIKLIDFGAAAYLDTTKLFGTFCGTLEYCSPEVLMGNKYKGPELEMWSMGVTLYTLVFGENPFFDVDETIQCVLKPPFVVSRPLMFLLMGLLHPDPRKRTSIKDCEKDLWVNQPIDISMYKWEDVLPNSEFHGNTASDNRMDSPDIHKTHEKWLKHSNLVPS
ncbi:PAS domain-containing serine/threonine-protein kinase-like [Mytilus galloprovincialis]|uniref:PAS domain-containing serine/threonine-protein kinase-like n=1 Tax=Mytilus galloprovincialis TaxID=29158 RepID=UPI003F7C454D